jgi:hypothetical protein
MNTTDFIQTDDNRIINMKYIRWVKKVNECMEICTKFNGCVAAYDTISVCKKNSPVGYNRLDRHFMQQDPLFVPEYNSKTSFDP